MKKSVKIVLSVLFITLSILAVLFIAFRNRQELGNSWETLIRLGPGWLAGLFGCLLGYVLFEAVGTWLCLRKQGFPLRLWNVLCINLIGLFYSNITPSAAGGQPMQVSSFREAGVPVAHGSTVVTVRLISNQFMVSVLSLAFLLLNRAFVYQQLEGAIWFVRIGWLINFAVVPLVMMAAFCRKTIQKIAVWLIRLLAKIRILRNPEATLAKATRVLDSYHTTVLELLRSPAQVLIQLLFSALSVLSLTGSVIFVYHAFAMSGVHWYQLLTLSLLLFVSASYTPLPGASGAQEGGFLYYFRNVFSGGTIGLALLTWRFFTYYLTIFIGVIFVVVGKLTLRRAGRRLSAVPGPAAPPADNTGGGSPAPDDLVSSTEESV